MPIPDDIKVAGLEETLLGERFQKCIPPLPVCGVVWDVYAHQDRAVAVSREGHAVGWTSSENPLPEARIFIEDYIGLWNATLDGTKYVPVADDFEQASGDRFSCSVDVMCSFIPGIIGYGGMGLLVSLATETPSALVGGTVLSGLVSGRIAQRNSVARRRLDGYMLSHDLHVGRDVYNMLDPFRM